jgi:hypothetical protein
MKTFKEYLIEGGGATKTTSPINQENVKATLNDIFKNLLSKMNLSETDTRLLGSTGKKRVGESSGDIDIAIDVTALISRNKLESEKDVFSFIESKIKKITNDYKIMTGMKTISLSYKIINKNGKQPDEFVQLDLMLVDKEKMDFNAWVQWSPKSEESDYKGVYRLFIFTSIMRNVDVEVIEKENDIPTKWKRKVLDTKQGVFSVLQTNIGKSGKIVKTKRTLERELLSYDIDEVIKYLLGPDATRKDTNSFESLYKFITSDKFPYKDKRKDILKMTAEDIISKGFILPKVLRKYI